MALLDNPGGATPPEMVVPAGELTKSDAIPTTGHMIGPAPMMTSLDMRGFSVSPLPVTGEKLSLFRASVGLRARFRARAAPHPRRAAPDPPDPLAKPADARFHQPLLRCVHRG